MVVFLASDPVGAVGGGCRDSGSFSCLADVLFLGAFPAQSSWQPESAAAGPSQLAGTPYSQCALGSGP